jgi:hypothetical protein
MCAVASIPIELHSIGRENFLILSQPLNQRRYKARIETHIVVYEQQEIASGRRGAPV